MKMKTYIEMGEKLAGNQAELAKLLDIKPNYLSMVKSDQRGLPDALCIQLADFIGADRLEIIAASNLITEKDEKKRKLFESCFTRAASIAAAALIFSGISMTSSPVQASQLASELPCNLYYVKLIICCLNGGRNFISYYQVLISFLNPFHIIHILLNILISAK